MRRSHVLLQILRPDNLDRHLQISEYHHFAPPLFQLLASKSLFYVVKMIRFVCKLLMISYGQAMSFYGFDCQSQLGALMIQEIDLLGDHLYCKSNCFRRDVKM